MSGPCGGLMFVFVPTKEHSFKEVQVRCGSTRHDGWQNLCDDCEKTVVVTPPWQCEDAGEEDFHPSGEW